MLYRYKSFLIRESVEIAKRVNDIYQNATFDEKVVYDRVLVKYLKKEKHKYNINTYRVDDLVLIEYWYNGMVTPVKIIEKNGAFYTITHDIKESKINKAPNARVKKSDIIDFFVVSEDNLKFSNIDMDVNLYNSVSLLSKIDQQNLYNGLLNVKMDEDMNVDDNEMYDKSNFNTFIKCLNALNIVSDFKSFNSEDKTVYSSFRIESINKDRLVDIFDRFPSMEKFNDKIKTSNKVDIYFNLKTNVVVSKFLITYGICLDGVNCDIAEFVFSKREFDIFTSLNNKYIQVFMKSIVEFNHKSALSLMKLKLKMSEYTPAYYMKKTPSFIINDTIIMSFYGIGKWDAGVMLTEDYNSLKVSFKEWVRKNIKDYKSVRFNIDAKDFWVSFKIKITL